MSRAELDALWAEVRQVVWAHREACGRCRTARRLQCAEYSRVWRRVYYRHLRAAQQREEN